MQSEPTEQAYADHREAATRIERHYTALAKEHIGRGDWETARILGMRGARECNEDAIARGLDPTECIARARALSHKPPEATA